MAEDKETRVIRCTTCGKYWRVYTNSLPPAGKKVGVFKCPSRHFAHYVVEDEIVVDAPIIESDFLSPLPEMKDTLAEEELRFVKSQKVQLYDCGFWALIAPPRQSPIPQLDLMKMKRPEEPNTLEDEEGNVYKLVISPNGVTYYRSAGRRDYTPDEEN